MFFNMSTLTFWLSISLLNVIVLITTSSAQSTQCPAVKNCLARIDKGEPCGVLPVPSRAVIAPLPPGQPFQLQKLRRGVWRINDIGYSSMILRHATHVTLLDVPDSSGGLNKADGSRTRLTDIVELVMNGTVPRKIDIVYSHAHFDHIGAARRIVQWVRWRYPSAKLRVFGGSSSIRLVRASISKRAVIPTHIVGRGGTTIWMAKHLRVRMKQLGGHAGADFALHIPRYGSEKAVLMYVDIVFPRWSPFSNLAFTNDMMRFVRIPDELLKFDFDYFIGGHVLLGSRNDVAEAGRYIRDIFMAAKNGVVTDQMRQRAGTSNFFVPGNPEFGNIWFLFLNGNRNLQAQACARILIEKWGCQIGGVAETAFSHCFNMITLQGIEE